MNARTTTKTLRFGTEEWAEKIVVELAASGLGQIAYRVANQDVFRRMIVTAARRGGMRVSTNADYFGDWSVGVHRTDTEDGPECTRQIRNTQRWITNMIGGPAVREIHKQERRDDGEFCDETCPGVEPS